MLILYAWPLIFACYCLIGCLVYNLKICTFHLQYATVEKDGEKYMTYKNFVCDYLKFVDQETNSETINLIAKIADTTKDR